MGGTSKTVGDMSSKESAKSPIEEGNWRKNIALFLAGQTISLLGSSIVQYAIIWHITLVTGSGLMLTAAFLCGLVPQFLITPFGGVWADRYPRKLMIVGSDAAVALATMGLAFVFMFTKEAWGAVFLVLVIRSFGTGLQMPAGQAVIPQIVPQKELMRIGGINGSLQSVIYLAAPVISGLLLKFLPLFSALFIDLVTAIIGIAVMRGIPIPDHRTELTKKGGYFTDMRVGLSFIADSKFYRRFFIFLSTLFLFIVPVNMLASLMVVRSFGDEVWRLSTVEAFSAGGMVLSGLFLAHYGQRRFLEKRMTTICMGAVASGGFILLASFCGVFWWLMVLIGLCGFSGPFMSASAVVYLQENVEEGIQGRVFSILQMMGTAMLSVGMLFFGPLADVVAVRWLLTASGLAMAFVGVYGYFTLAIPEGRRGAAKPAAPEDSPEA